MLTKIHKPRNPNGFVKYAYKDVNISWTLKTEPWLVKLPTFSLSKAVDITEWDQKLVSNKIKVVAVTYSLMVQPRIGSFSGDVPNSTPVRVDVVRFTQTTAGDIDTRYSGSHTNKNWYLLDHVINQPSVVNPTISVFSPPNIPLDRTALYNPKIYDSNLQNCNMTPLLQYNANTLGNFVLMSQNVLTKYIEVDCEIDVPDDGNVSTVIDLNNCVGGIPVVFFVGYWNLRWRTAPFPLYSNYTVSGTIGVVYQDIGTKLSHLV